MNTQADTQADVQEIQDTELQPSSLLVEESSTEFTIPPQEVYTDKRIPYPNKTEKISISLDQAKEVVLAAIQTRVEQVNRIGISQSSQVSDDPQEILKRINIGKFRSVIEREQARAIQGDAPGFILNPAGQRFQDIDELRTMVSKFTNFIGAKVIGKPEFRLTSYLFTLPEGYTGFSHVMRLTEAKAVFPTLPILTKEISCPRPLKNKTKIIRYIHRRFKPTFPETKEVTFVTVDSHYLFHWQVGRYIDHATENELRSWVYLDYWDR